MDLDLLRAELERLFELEELFTVSRDLLGFEPETVGGTAGKGSFVRALTDYCVEQESVEALCDAVVASKSEASPDLSKLGVRGVSDRDDIPLGDRLGPFLISRKLGEGTAGVTYAARADDQDIRLKVLRREAVRDQRALRRFLTLTRLAGRVFHVGLPFRIRAGVIDGRYYVAHQAVEGQALAARIGRTGPMHVNEARDVLRALLESLQALHENRLVHGNLKLENILSYRTGDGGQPRVLLLDAGTDRLRTRSAANGHVEPWSVSSPKTVAPEQLRGHPPTAASDIYSFGAVLFEILTGKPVFEVRTVADAIVAHLSEKPPVPSAVAPRGWITKELDEFVLSLLEKDPARRLGSATTLLEILDQLGKPVSAARVEKTMSEEELVERIQAVVNNPESEDHALALESAADEGADPARVAESFVIAARELDKSDEAKVAVAKGLLFRAGRLFQENAQNLEGAERAYAAIVALDPSEGTAVARLDDIRHKLKKYDDLIESLLGRAETASSGPERAAILARIAKLYRTEIGEPEQALVALTQAFCEDPRSEEYPSEIEELAGTNAAAWGEVLAACNDASTQDAPAEAKNALFSRMGRWYESRYQRPDLALSCYQAIIATDPSNDEALDGLAALYRKAQQWQELSALLIRRADAAADPSKARDLRCEAASILENRLNDVGGARDLYGQVVAADPGHTSATDALLRIFEQGRDHANVVKLLEMQLATLRGEDKLRCLCRIAEVYEVRLGDDAEAVRRYNAVLLDDPTNLDALRGLDRLYSKAGRYQDLLENLEQQIRLAPTPRQKIALWERVTGIQDEEFLNHEKAGQALEQVLELDPAHEGALTNLARHYRALDRWEDLTSLYERHLALATENQQKLELAVARARVLSDQIVATDRAILAYERVLEIDPEHGAALESLARLRETAGQEDAALAAIEALAEKAENPEAKAERYVRAAKLLESQGDRDGAIQRYKRALDATPKDTTISAALRAAYVARGDVNAAVELLEKEIPEAEGDRQKAKLAAELATLHRTKLKDDERAEKAARRALDFDPTNTDALTIVAETAFDAQRFVEAAASYEKLAGRADTLEHEAAVRALERYVDSLARGGSTEKALVAMDTLLRLAPDDPQAVARVASVTFDHGSPGRARELLEDLLTRFGSALTTGERATATYKLGEARRKMGDLDAAIEALENAADLDPSSPLPLIALATAHEAKEAWAKVVDAKTRHLDLAEGEARVRLLVEIGELAATKLGDRALATKSLVAAVDERPDDRKLLTRLMQLYSEEKDWQKLVDIVMKLADFVEDPKQKAKYLQTAAMVTGTEMRDYDQALSLYAKVLELDPTSERAVDDTIELLEERGDHAGAVERLKDKAKTASDAKNNPRMLEAFNKLGTLYREKLGRIGHAIDALEAAQTLEPDNKERNQLLAELYASDPEKYLEKAVSSQMSMLRQNPYRVESYKLLRRLFTETKRADPAWCLCQALYVLKLGEPDEERFFRRMRSEDPAFAQEVMTSDDWLELVFHADADPMLTSLFAVIEPAIIVSRAEGWEALGYDPVYAVDPSHHPYPISQTLHYAAGVTGTELPLVFEDTQPETGLGFLHAARPAILLGTAALMADASPQALAFVAGRHLAYYRAGFYIRHLVASGTSLRAWLFAAIKLNVPQFPVAPDIEGPVRDAITALDKHLSPPLKDHLSRIVSKLVQSGAALDLRKWVQGVDQTADRIGFILAHDLETAVEIIRASDDSSSAVNAQTRLKELVLYAISEQYFTLRQRLRIAIDN